MAKIEHILIGGFRLDVKCVSEGREICQTF